MRQTSELSFMSNSQQVVWAQAAFITLLSDVYTLDDHETTSLHVLLGASYWIQGTGLSAWRKTKRVSSSFRPYLMCEDWVWCVQVACCYHTAKPHAGPSVSGVGGRSSCTSFDLVNAEWCLLVLTLLLNTHRKMTSPGVTCWPWRRRIWRR